jgi:hypothetical protein
LCPGSLGKLKDRMRGGAAIIRATIIRGVAYE